MKTQTESILGTITIKYSRAHTTHMDGFCRSLQPQAVSTTVQYHHPSLRPNTYVDTGSATPPMLVTIPTLGSRALSQGVDHFVLDKTAKIHQITVCSRDHQSRSSCSRYHNSGMHHFCTVSNHCTRALLTYYRLTLKWVILRLLVVP